MSYIHDTEQVAWKIICIGVERMILIGQQLIQRQTITFFFTTCLAFRFLKIGPRNTLSTVSYIRW